MKQFGELNLRPDRGALVENFTFIHLYRGLSVLDELNFWRAKNGTEVDFVLQAHPSDSAEEFLLPLEVKYQPFRRATIPSGLQSFLTAYPTSQAVVITKDYLNRIEKGKIKVFFFPVWLLGIFP